MRCAYAGIKTDERARALGAVNHQIAGLYATGNDMASILGGDHRGRQRHALVCADVQLYRGKASRGG